MLTATEDGQQLDARITHIPQEPGRYKLTLRAEEQSGELVTTNNQLTAFLTVRDCGLRVLYLHGDAPHEPKYLRWAIDASADIQLDHVWINHGNRHWPIDIADYLEPPGYDVYIVPRRSFGGVQGRGLEIASQPNRLAP